MAMLAYSFERASKNKKTGPIPVTSASPNSCPDSCPLKYKIIDGKKVPMGCYKDYGPMSWTEKYIKDSMDLMLAEIAQLPKGQLWRMNQRGDFHGPKPDSELIDQEAMKKIVKANRGKDGFGYTHKKHHENLEIIRYANDNGFTVNISANDYQEADYWFEQGFPTVCMLPEGSKEKSYKTEAGHTIVTCPHDLHGKKIQCINCKLCADSKRDFIVGFPVHGAGKKKANLIACENI